MLAQGMNAQFIESIVFDKTLYKYGILDIKDNAVKIMKQQVCLSLSLSQWNGKAFETLAIGG